MEEQEVFKSKEELAEELKAVKMGCVVVSLGMLITAGLAYWIFG